MRLIKIVLVSIILLPLVGCQDTPRSSEYYRANLAQAQKDEQTCKQLRADGKEPNDVLAKNCRLAHDVLFRQANAGAAAGIKNSQ